MKTPPITINPRVLLTASLLVAAALWAQPLQALSPPERSITAKPLLMPPPPQVQLQPELLIRSSGARLPIQAQQLTIDTQIIGRLAQTRVELVLFNPNEQVLEAELQFPLQNGQEVTAFALDINGKLRAAVAVEKAKAQQVFEDITRVRVDPALLERTVGNNYKLRVYPMPARGVRRVALTITEVLKPSGSQTSSQANALAQYAFSLTPFSATTQVQWRVTVLGNAANNVKPGAGLAAFSSNGRDALLSVQGARGSLPESLGLTLPYARGAVQTTHAFDGEEFVYIEVPAPVLKLVPARAPKTIGLVWDASGSMQRADHARIFAVLGSYFAKLGTVDVKLQVARNVAEKQVSFTVRGGDWSTLKAAIQALDYDGGTAASALSFTDSADVVLIATDGISNFGNAQFKRPASRSFALLASAANNAAAMRAWTQASGGDALDLLQLSPAQALERLSSDSVRLSAVSGKGVTRITSGGALPEAGVFTVAGVLSARSNEPASVELEFLHNGNLTRQTVNITRSAAANDRTGDGGSIAAQRWASLRIAELAAAGSDDNTEQITAVGKRFALVSDSTSLIVLDNVSDYLRHAITPPAELRAQYDAQLQRQQGQVERQKTDNINRVAQAWAARTQWWTREFPKGAPVELAKAIAPLAPGAPAIGGGAVTGAVQRQSQREAAVRDQAPRESVEVAASRSRSDRAAPADAPAPAPAERVEKATLPPAPAAAALPAIAAAPRPAPVVTQSSLASAAPSPEAKKAAATPTQAAVQTSIRLQTMQASSAALRQLRELRNAERYAYYMKLRGDNTDSSAFYLEAAQVFFDKGEAALGLRVLSNLAEMNLENRHLLRVLGTRLVQAKLPELALPVFARVLRLAPNEPQSQRDLGLAHAQTGNPQAAIEALYNVVIGKWDGRFADVDMTALAELNAIVATSGKALDVRFIDPRLLGNLPLDLRVVLSWDADNTDVDLHVLDPNKEEAFYGRQLTYQGGRMSRDFTGGYGPEEFALRQAKPGIYRVTVKLYGSRAQTVTSGVTAQLTLSRGFGTKAQQDEVITVRLEATKDSTLIGEFEVK